jgi:hypothetical protein
MTSDYASAHNEAVKDQGLEPFIALLTFIGAEFDTLNTGGWCMVTYWQATDTQYIGIGAGCIVAYDGDYRTPCTDSTGCACLACSDSQGTVLAEY